VGVGGSPFLSRGSRRSSRSLGLATWRSQQTDNEEDASPLRLAMTDEVGNDGERRGGGSDVLQCVFGRRSGTPCGSIGAAPLAMRLQTLDELDATASVAHGGTSRISWIILSRVGVDYLGGGALGRWLICPVHRRELLEAWQAPGKCCHPAHQPARPSAAADHDLALGTVTLSTSVRTIREEGAVLPVGGRLCAACQQRTMEDVKTGVTGPQFVVPSPFCPPPEAITGPVVAPPSLPVADASCLPELTLMKTEVIEDEPESVVTTNASITIKEEPADYVVDVEGSPEFREVTENFEREETDQHEEDFFEEEEEDDLFSEDSDMDRTWVPVLAEKAKKRRRTRRSRRGAVFTDTSSEEEEEVDDPTAKPDPPPVKKRKTAESKAKVANQKKTKAKPKAKAKAKVKNLPMKTNDTGGSYFCSICQISFYKRTSYLQHMRSSKKAHKDLARGVSTVEEEDEDACPSEFACVECREVFRDRAALLRHINAEHNAKRKSFYCVICDVFLKNEAAFKSHNSKLHLERSARAFYCRECDGSFSCLLLHQEHIKTHRLSNEMEGVKCLQCPTCGKLFTQAQALLYQRHLATHDAELDENCACEECKTSAKKDPGAADLEDQQQKRDQCVFKCGICPDMAFADPFELDRHVKEVHKKAGAPVADVIQNQQRALADGEVKPKEVRLKLTDSTERNWAAEFGYGRTSPTAVKKPGDLFLKMRSMFKGEDDEDDEEDEEEAKKDNQQEAAKEKNGEVADVFEPFKTRGFKGKVKASLLKTPRTLSEASLVTRRRLEALIRKARDHQSSGEKKTSQKRKTGKRKLTPPPATMAAAPSSSEDEEYEEEEEEGGDFDGFLEDEDESLLFPLANGWLMERTPSSKDHRKFFTSFWSPYGVQCDDVEAVKEYAKREKISLDVAVFEKALRRLQQQAAA